MWIILLLSVSFVTASKVHLREDDSELQPSERFKLNSFPVAKKIVQHEGFPDAVGSIGVIKSLVTIDYNAPPKQVIKKVGDALVPILSAGLSLIPGVGPIIAGVLSAVWSIFSPLLGEEKKEDPMEKIIKDIYGELNKIKEHINDLAEKIPKQMREEMDANLASFVNKALHGEISRNDYVCSKYAMVSKVFSDTLRANKSLSRPERAEMIALIENCDNFLKDTAEAFVYPEYAHVLWIPSVITTIMRVSFLTEVSNYGHALNIDISRISLFWSELKKEIKRQLKFYDLGLRKRLNIIRNKAFNEYEEEACKMQRELFYLDREMYPHGVPQYFEIREEDNNLNLSNYNVSGNNQPHHIQIFFEELFERNHTYSVVHLNCFWGPGIMRTIAEKYSGSPWEIVIRYVPNKMYEFRVAYFVPNLVFALDGDENFEDMEQYLADDMHEIAHFSDRKVTAYEENENTLRVTIEIGKPSNFSTQRFIFETGSHRLLCEYFQANEARAIPEYKECEPATIYSGAFVIENVASYYIGSEDELLGKIIVVHTNYTGLANSLIWGVEIIALSP